MLQRDLTAFLRVHRPDDQRVGDFNPHSGNCSLLTKFSLAAWDGIDFLQISTVRLANSLSAIAPTSPANFAHAANQSGISDNCPAVCTSVS